MAELSKTRKELKAVKDILAKEKLNQVKPTETEAGKKEELEVRFIFHDKRFELFHFPSYISIPTQSAHRRGTKRQSRKGQEVADVNLYHLLPRNHENPPWMRPCEKSHSSLKVGYLEWYWRSEDDVCNKLCLYFHISYYSFFQINAE